MSLQIAVAHTGQRLDADPVSFNSIEGLKHWIAEVTGIPRDLQILLTSQGKHVKLQLLLTEKEIFVYDRELSFGGKPVNVSPIPLPDTFTPDDAPNILENNSDLREWQKLFQSRRDWAFTVLERSHSMSQEAFKYFTEQATIDKATQIAVGNHDSHIRQLEQKYREVREWFDGVEKEAVDNVRRLDVDYGQLGVIPAKSEFIQFLSNGLRPTQTTQGGRKTSPNPSASLQDFMDRESLRKATATSKKVRETFGKRVAGMGTQLEKVTADYKELLGAVDQSQSRTLGEDSEETQRLYNEIEAVVNKVESDLEHIMELPANPKSVAQVSKMALLHTRNFLPNIKEYAMEMSDLVRRSIEQKNYAVQNAIDSMRGIANIESVISSMNGEVEAISIPQEGVAAFELISLVGRLPYVYGTLLVEAVRRREWMEKMEKDTSSLAEEMATYQEEEERRRKRWLKPIADVVNLDIVQGSGIGFELNVQPEKNKWPTVTRENLVEYLKILQGLDSQTAEAEALGQAIKELDRPTKQQIKRAKNFKMGSVHEPAFGKGSQLLLRGDDEIRVLREANTKLEDELKGHKSRVRRLEDLLHRQTHVSRLSIGGGPPSFGPQSPADPSTPTIDVPSPSPLIDHSRRSSISSRRYSTNQGQEDKRRIVRLEQELAAEKEARASLEKDVQNKKDGDEELRRHAQEATSMKEEIMDNMKAQQREFANERRSLEDEIQTYKSKIEEAEDELDRILGSRDNERTGVDTKIHDLLAEMENIRKEAAAQGKQATEHITQLQTEIQQYKEARNRQTESLSAVFRQLSPDRATPNDSEELLSQLEDLATRSSTYQRELQQAIAVAKTENENTRAMAHEQETDLKSKLSLEKDASFALREQLDREKAKVASITAELDEERGHLRDLRAKFAEGETGSEALRKRVEEEEAKVGRLQVELAETKSHSNSLDVELMHLQKKVLKYEEFDSSRTHERQTRAKELSKRLYLQQDRLVGLVESLGFAITYEDGQMALQRASKVSNSTTLSDPNGLGRSVTTPSPTLFKHSESPLNLSFLQWPESADPEQEDRRYHELIDNLNRFDLDVFGDAVAKRMRDIEHTARKYQREMRVYREKSHRFQAEGHDKIAYRSFKEGDLALFLPTRNQATRPWAAFNVGAPHYFLREQDSHRLHGREWLVARISKIEERVVDLSKTMDTTARASMDGRSIASNSAVSFEDDNPFELSDGLRWYLLDAAEEKSGAPGTPGLGKTTVASARVTGQGQMEPTKKKSSNDPAKTLGKSLDSRRSSGNSKKSAPLVGARNSTEILPDTADPGTASNPATRGASPAARPGPSHLRESEEAATAAPGHDEVRKDLLWGP
ncbi:Taz1-interactin-like proteing factor 1 [Periconia macrospinosa]|uniref:Autophagy-related protein 11 n=1 Tax=Periconia macrospinosa TaxID=97972 RepID=A0A2V1ED98_9PLEO|nr:Taz1-interactin-like proteing factor 1 [Periconia macrospinosa]